MLPCPTRALLAGALLSCLVAPAAADSVWGGQFYITDVTKACLDLDLVNKGDSFQSILNPKVEEDEGRTSFSVYDDAMNLVVVSDADFVGLVGKGPAKASLNRADATTARMNIRYNIDTTPALVDEDDRFISAQGKIVGFLDDDCIIRFRAAYAKRY